MNKNIEDAKNLLDFSSPDTVYIAMLLPRKKDGFELNIGTKDRAKDLDSDIKARKVIGSLEEYDVSMEALLRQATSLSTARIYLTFNPRSSLKAFGNLQTSINTNLHNIKSIVPTIKPLDREFKSYLMKPEAKAKTKFHLIDIDTKEIDMGTVMDKVANVTEPIRYFEIKNGYHLLVKPCNPKELIKYLPSNCEIKEDAMVCLYYK